ncbi:glycosyltransferase [Mycobacterium paraterrae]|uniref:Glycosyltransferase n=1 Tax=Mycobacterium paraterrae TaxID=577492 RepID=A0ABY3VU56_9MYCO|nr:glycosyltransferase [Mycobacterium paraterrae]UMB70713.1 glycosyltransferase [Mycobacterium paraterrae]
MKVLHVVTLVTPDGAFGGPTRVAVNLCSTLRDQGHDATIAAGFKGFDEPPTALGGVPARLFPARRVLPGFGHAPTYAPALGRWIDEHAAKFDIVHIHLARDLVTLPVAARLHRMGIPYVVQTHGMIAPRNHPLARLIDRWWTVKLLRSAATHFHLNSTERKQLLEVAGTELRLRELRNGVPTPTAPTVRTLDTLPEVLFLARLHERKRPEVFAQAALSLLRSGADARFVVVGPPAGAEAGVDAIIAQARSEGFGENRIRREPAVEPDRTGDRMSCAAVYVLPSVREPFPMTVLEAMMLGIPVVIRQDNGLADFVETHRCGVVVDDGPEGFAQAISDVLADRSGARAMGRRARSAAQSAFGIAAVGAELEQAYRDVVYGSSE